MALSGSRRHRRAWSIAALLCLAAVAAIGMLYAQSAHQLPIVGPQSYPVLVAVRDIPVGTSAAIAEQDGSFRAVEMQQNEIPIGALGEPASLRGTVAKVAITAGETVLASQWALPH